MPRALFPLCARETYAMKGCDFMGDESVSVSSCGREAYAETQGF